MYGESVVLVATSVVVVRTAFEFSLVPEDAARDLHDMVRDTINIRKLGRE